MSLIAEFIAGRRPPELYQEYLGPLFETWADILMKAAPPSGRVLDIACGTGIVSRALARQPGVQKVSAFDVSAEMLQVATRQTGEGAAIEFTNASAENVPFEENEFNSAYCQQGLQFFPDKVSAMKEAARVVTPGGKAAFSIWSYAKNGNPVFEVFEQIVARELGEDLIPFGPFSFGDAAALEKTAHDAGQKVISLTREERVAPLPDARSLVLFDLLFLGRPGTDGQLQPLFDPADASMDPLIEELSSELEEATARFRQPDGSLIAPSASHILVIEAQE